MVRFRLKNVVSLFLVCITLILIISQNPRYWKPCSEQSLNLSGRMHLEIHTMSAPSFATIRKLHSISTYANGHNEPTTCKSALHNLAIIVPLREREKQFRMLLNHLYGILSRQQVAFTIYALTQSSKGIFNRAKLFNVGIHEALKDQNFDCFVFHDADLLLEDDRCLYRCHKDHPTHLSAFIDIFSYESMNYSINCAPQGFPNAIQGFGGVSAMTRKQIDDVNGFSNKYWGWGGEDDDMIIRLWKKGYSVRHFFGNFCSYTMLKHDHEESNPVNEYRYKLLMDSTTRAATDGLDSLSYEVISIERRPLYINITVDIGTELEDFKYASDLSDICVF